MMKSWYSASLSPTSLSFSAVAKDAKLSSKGLWLKRSISRKEKGKSFCVVVKNLSRKFLLTFRLENTFNEQWSRQTVQLIQFSSVKTLRKCEKLCENNSCVLYFIRKKNAMSQCRWNVFFFFLFNCSAQIKCPKGFENLEFLCIDKWKFINFVNWKLCNFSPTQIKIKILINFHDFLGHILE